MFLGLGVHIITDDRELQLCLLNAARYESLEMVIYNKSRNRFTDEMCMIIAFDISPSPICSSLYIHLFLYFLFILVLLVNTILFHGMDLSFGLVSFCLVQYRFGVCLLLFLALLFSLALFSLMLFCVLVTIVQFCMFFFCWVLMLGFCLTLFYFMLVHCLFVFLQMLFGSS